VVALRDEVGVANLVQAYGRQPPPWRHIRFILCQRSRRYPLEGKNAPSKSPWRPTLPTIFEMGTLCIPR
jgi:hypothetical protein